MPTKSSKSIETQFQRLVAHEKRKIQAKERQEAVASPEQLEAKKLGSTLKKLTSTIQEIPAVAPDLVTLETENVYEGPGVRATITVDHPNGRKVFTILFNASGAYIKPGKSFGFRKDNLGDVITANERKQHWQSCLDYLHSTFLQMLAKLIAEADLCRSRMNKQESRRNKQVSRRTKKEGIALGRKWAQSATGSQKGEFCYFIQDDPDIRIWELCETVATSDLCTFWSVEDPSQIDWIPEKYLRGFVKGATELLIAELARRTEREGISLGRIWAVSASTRQRRNFISEYASCDKSELDPNDIYNTIMDAAAEENPELLYSFWEVDSQWQLGQLPHGYVAGFVMGAKELLEELAKYSDHEEWESMDDDCDDDDLEDESNC